MRSQVLSGVRFVEEKGQREDDRLTDSGGLKMAEQTEYGQTHCPAIILF